MKKIYYLFASLTLGLLMASCQNDLEEVINESIVQDELTTTRSEQGITEMTDEELETLAATASVYTITGSNIIGDPDSEEYTIPSIPYGTTSYVWNYNSNMLSCVSQSDNTIELEVLPLTGSTTYYDDVLLSATMYNSTGTALGYAYKNVGVNGPLKSNFTIHVYRASDNVEVYPHGNVLLQPNTVYNAYFTPLASTTVSNLTWIIDYEDTSYNYASSGYYRQFKTNSIGWTPIKVVGVCSPYTANKLLVDEYLYGQ